MRRREFIALMGVSVTCPFAALAQQAGRTYRLGGPGRLLDAIRRLPSQCLMNFHELASSKAKTSLSIGTTMDRALICFRNLRRSLSQLRRMSFMPSEMLQFALFSWRQQRFRSSGVLTIWSRRDWLSHWPDPRVIQQVRASSRQNLTANDRKS